MQKTCSICGKEKNIQWNRKQKAHVCINCLASIRRNDPSTHEPCVECGDLGVVAKRNLDGSSICPKCYERQRRRNCKKHEVCVRCGQKKLVDTRTSQGPICQACRMSDPANQENCAICGLTKRLGRRKEDGQAVCINCYGKERRKDTSRFKTCPHCGKFALPVGQKDGSFLCEACHNKKPCFLEKCSGCGKKRRVSKRLSKEKALCSHCSRYHSSNYKKCSMCGKSKPVAGRGNDGGALCSGCVHKDPERHDTCARCGTVASVAARNKHSGEAMCSKCYSNKKLGKCTHCLKFGKIRARGLCMACYQRAWRIGTLSSIS